MPHELLLARRDGFVIETGEDGVMHARGAHIPMAHIIFSIQATEALAGIQQAAAERAQRET